jgi:hypothetical protein
MAMELIGAYALYDVLQAMIRPWLDDGEFPAGQYAIVLPHCPSDIYGALFQPRPSGICAGHLVLLPAAAFHEFPVDPIESRRVRGSGDLCCPSDVAWLFLRN